MLLIWGMFTVGFFFGVFFTYRLFVDRTSGDDEAEEPRMTSTTQFEASEFKATMASK